MELGAILKIGTQIIWPICPEDRMKMKKGLVRPPSGHPCPINPPM